MNKERRLYDKFLNKLLELLDNPEISDKELKVIQTFLADNNIQANPETNEMLGKLAKEFELPFEIEEIEVKR